MASAWGAWLHADDWRCGVDAQVVSETETTCTVRVKCIFDNVYLIGSNASNGNSVSCACDGQSSSENVSLGKNYGHGRGAVVKTADFTVQKGLGTGRNIWCSASIRVAIGSPGTGSAGVHVWIPSRSYSVPHPPKSPSASRVDDGRQRVAWTADYTGMDGAYPWTKVLVDRRTDGGAWVEIGSSTWDVTEFTDGSTSADHAYEYGVRSNGPGGTSARVSAGTVFTTPAAPSLSVRKTAARTAVVSMSTAPRHADGYEIQRRTGSGQWSALGLEPSGSSFTDAACPDGTVRYRVRARRAQGAAVLWSDWSESEQIVTVTPPLAPALGELPSVLQLGTTVLVTWTPNHPDLSRQSAAQIEVSKGSAKTVVDIQGDAASTRVSLDVKGTLGIRVRTKGVHADWGAWSARGDATVLPAPSVHFTSPPEDGATVDSIPLAVAWEAADETGIQGAELTIAKTGCPDTAVSVIGSSASIVDLENDCSYTLSLTVRAGSGLTSGAKRTFKTKWAGPAAPALAIDYTEDLSARVFVSAGAKDGLPATERIDLWRVGADGTRTLLAEGLLDGRCFVDRLAPLNTPYAYEGVGVATSGAATASTVQAFLDSRGMESFSYGADASRSLVVGYDGNGGESVSHGGESFSFFGCELPVFYGDGSLESKVDRSYTVIGRGAAELIRSLSRAEHTAWFRSFDGRVLRVRAEWSLSRGPSASDSYSAGCSMTEVEWEEPMRG